MKKPPTLGIQEITYHESTYHESIYIMNLLTIDLSVSRIRLSYLPHLDQKSTYHDHSRYRIIDVT